MRLYQLWTTAQLELPRQKEIVQVKWHAHTASSPSSRTQRLFRAMSAPLPHRICGTCFKKLLIPIVKRECCLNILHATKTRRADSDFRYFRCFHLTDIVISSIPECVWVRGYGYATSHRDAGFTYVYTYTSVLGYAWVCACMAVPVGEEGGQRLRNTCERVRWRARVAIRDSFMRSRAQRLVQCCDPAAFNARDT